MFLFLIFPSTDLSLAIHPLLHDTEENTQFYDSTHFLDSLKDVDDACRLIDGHTTKSRIAPCRSGHLITIYNQQK